MKHIVTGQDQRVGNWVSRVMGDRVDFAPFTAIGLEDDFGDLLAGTVYDYYNGANVNIHFAAVKHQWYCRPFIHFCFWYPFEQLKVRRLTGLVPETNETARRFDEKLGFVYETRIKDAHPTGDVLVYSMFRHQCRWLNIKARYPNGQAVSTSSA